MSGTELKVIATKEKKENVLDAKIIDERKEREKEKKKLLSIRHGIVGKGFCYFFLLNQVHANSLKNNIITLSS